MVWKDVNRYVNSGGGAAAYIASKGAIVSLTKTSAVDFAKQGIRINAVAPAVIDTAMSRSSREGSPDPEAMQADTVQVIVQVNGKLRARLQLPAGATKEELEAAALADENVQRFVADKSIRKVIVVPGKLVNVVV